MDIDVKDGRSWLEEVLKEERKNSKIKKYVLVPAEDIEKLEEERVELCNILSDVDILRGVISHLWKVTHRKYEEVIK